jgi:hypothetical protein
VKGQLGLEHQGFNGMYGARFTVPMGERFHGCRRAPTGNFFKALFGLEKFLCRLMRVIRIRVYWCSANLLLRFSRYATGSP